MAETTFPQFIENQSRDAEEASEAEEKLSQECKELILSLPKEKGWKTRYLYLFQDFWCTAAQIQGIINFQKHFQAKDGDVIVASVQKSGTTWLKALTFAIMNRHQYFTTPTTHPLLNSNPHELVLSLEQHLYRYTTHDQVPDLSNMLEPRIFSTHVPFPSLGNSIKESNCKIIYICRNPFDTFVSTWFFFNEVKPDYLPTLTLEEAFERYCKGNIAFGPIWYHMLGYWRESIARSHKVLFLKYEDLKEDVNFHVKKMAKFMGYPFTLEEERNGVVENLIKLCSFEKMKELEVNKFGAINSKLEKRHFFRKAEVGDWVNYFSPSMVEKLSQIMEEKLSGSRLSFRMHS